MTFLTIYIIIAILTFIFHLLTFNIWTDMFNKGSEEALGGEKVGQSFTFALIFPIYWMLVFMIVGVLLLAMFFSLFD